MSIVHYATAAACVLYGVYVYRVLRHAEYHDFGWLTRRTKAAQAAPGSTIHHRIPIIIMPPARSNAPSEQDGAPVKKRCFPHD